MVYKESWPDSSRRRDNHHNKKFKFNLGRSAVLSSFRIDSAAQIVGFCWSQGVYMVADIVKSQRKFVLAGEKRASQTWFAVEEG